MTRFPSGPANRPATSRLGDMVSTAVARGRTALLLYAGTAFLIGALYILVWQTPVHQAIEAIPSLLPQVAQSLLEPLIGQPPLPAPPAVISPASAPPDLTPPPADNLGGTAVTQPGLPIPTAANVPAAPGPLSAVAQPAQETTAAPVAAAEAVASSAAA